MTFGEDQVDEAEWTAEDEQAWREHCEAEQDAIWKDLNDQAAAECEAEMAYERYLENRGWEESELERRMMGW